ncbi:MAG: carboxypeptidase-like regulatory domain-containing protein [Bacteroidota bacterium]
MIKIKIILQFIIIASICSVSAQEANYINIKGLIVGDDFIPISYVNIISKKTGLGTISSDNGSFSIRIEKTDTLKLSSMGYKTKSISVIKLDKKKNYIILAREIYLLGEVNIIGFTKWEEFKQEFIKKELKPLEQKILVIEGLPSPYTKLIPNAQLSSNPITMIYQLFNKKEILKRKQKRWNKTYNKSWQEYHKKIKIENK